MTGTHFLLKIKQRTLKQKVDSFGFLKKIRNDDLECHVKLESYFSIGVKSRKELS